MRAVASTAPDLPPSTILRMATTHGAAALGRKGEIGELSANARADLISIPFSGSIAEVYETAIHHPGEVSTSMIDGQWTLKPST
jgi:cytosine/adenosine deaminase-related metal-dependent hydrolase